MVLRSASAGVNPSDTGDWSRTESFNIASILFGENNSPFDLAGRRVFGSAGAPPAVLLRDTSTKIAGGTPALPIPLSRTQHATTDPIIRIVVRQKSQIA